MPRKGQSRLDAQDSHVTQQDEEQWQDISLTDDEIANVATDSLLPRSIEPTVVAKVAREGSKFADLTGKAAEVADSIKDAFRELGAAIRYGKKDGNVFSSDAWDDGHKETRHGGLESKINAVLGKICLLFAKLVELVPGKLGIAKVKIRAVVESLNKKAENYEKAASKVYVPSKDKKSWFQSLERSDRKYRKSKGRAF